MLISLLIGAAIGAIAVAAIIGIVEIRAGMKELFSQYPDAGTKFFIPRDEFLKYAKGKPELKPVVQAFLDDGSKTGTFLLKEERGLRRTIYQTVDKELDQEVDPRGYVSYRGNDTLYIRT